MTGLILEFSDDVTPEMGIQDEREDWLCIPRLDYLELIETARKIRADWPFREGTDFVCETCKSFIMPAKALHHVLSKLERTDFFWDSDLLWEIRSHLCKSYNMTDAAWTDYCDGKLRHIPFLYDKKGELEWEEAGPQYIAYDEVVFKFRKKCVCDGIYKRMYENVR